MPNRLHLHPLRRARLLLGAFTAVALFLLAADRASAQWLCSCPADFKNTTNCIETRLQRINDNCYYLIVYNHQSSTSLTRCNTYNNTSELTMRVRNVACWRDNGISMTITAVDNNPTYPTGTPLWHKYDPLCPTCYNRSYLYDSLSAPFNAIRWRRTPNFGNTPNPMRNCEVDTFRLCLDCETDISASCIGKLEFEVYFGYPNPICIDEIGLGKDREIVTVAPPDCEEDECAGCPKYLTTCNSYSITYGCDYADVAIVNDHGYPACTMVDEFEIIVGGGRRACWVCAERKPIQRRSYHSSATGT